MPIEVGEGRAICPHHRRGNYFDSREHTAPVNSDGEIGHHYLVPGQTYVCPGVGEKVKK